MRTGYERDWAGAGARPFIDYIQGEGCTNGNCNLRPTYLTATTALLVGYLTCIAGQWTEGGAQSVTLADAARTKLQFRGPGLWAAAP